MVRLACEIVRRADAEGRPCRWVFAESIAGRAVAALARRLNAGRQPLPVPDAVVGG
jgi:hypothetical protein